MYGKYPENASKQSQEELLDALDRMVVDAVAIFPESSEITIDALANKGSVSNIHLEYINAANAEISKAVLGQTLTTELSGKTGSYAAAQTHNLVRKDLAKADRNRIGAAFSRLARIYTLYNFGTAVIPPNFTFIEDEELYVEHVKRDVELYGIGWRPTKAYIAREYAIPEEDFSVAGETEPEKAGSFAEQKPVSRFKHNHTSTGTCGCKEEKKPGFFKRLFMSFVSIFVKEKRIRTKDERLMAEFEESQLKAGQEEMNRIVDQFVNALGTVDKYEEASDALMKVYDTAELDRLAYLIDEIRYAAQGIGGRRG
jgi:phage gp29-like protein